MRSTLRGACSHESHEADPCGLALGPTRRSPVACGRRSASCCSPGRPAGCCPCRPRGRSRWASLGVVIGALAWRALFSGLASGNIARILRRPARACVFGFTSPKGWLITASMIVLGATLRHSDLPKPLLAVPYAAIGMALFLASLTYYSHLIRSHEGATS